MKHPVFSSKKDVHKAIRSIIQLFILLAIMRIIIVALFTFQTYVPYDDETRRTDSGFVALSYFGVDRDGNDSLISVKRLELHLKALHDAGYVTISQQDILDYYKHEKPLPPKSLFLLFEDGRRDTAIFAQKILEKYNYRANILTYADKFEKGDTKFLMPEDLTELTKSTFWELGTNGYRLEYINVFDKYGNFYGNLNSIQYSKVVDKLDRQYDHYLMDFKRDEHGIPTESRAEMESRIANDYKNMRNIYTQSLGYVPPLYILMHSNTGQFGTNEKASAINADEIKNTFDINFNREGDSYNTDNSSIYDLTRMQPQAYWSTNHLIMRIIDDTGKNIPFITGNSDNGEHFDIISGAAQFEDADIILTSTPGGNALLKLKNTSQNNGNINLSVRLLGNKLGSQTIYINANEALTSYIAVRLNSGVFQIVQSIDETEKVLHETSLYDGELSIHDKGDVEINVSLTGENISIMANDVLLAEDLPISNQTGQAIFLESAWAGHGYSQRNLTDDVYDGYFQNLIISTDTEAIFEGRLSGFKRISHEISLLWDRVVNWFIKNL